MSITAKDVIKVELTDDEMKDIINVANKVSAHIVDRADLHERDYLERFIDVLMGEVAENMILKWLHNNGKYAVSAVDKNSGTPDPGHDILLKNLEGKDIKCSVKSSLSAQKGLDEILTTFTIATKKTEIREVNVQVYFWLDIRPKNGHRRTVPSITNAAIIGWVGKNDIEKFTTYATENRQAPDKKLKEMRSMNSLLNHIQ